MHVSQRVNDAAMLAAAAFLLALIADNADAAGSKAGRDLASLHCARCHVIPGRSNMGIGSTPSFKIMVQSRAKDWREKFEAFFSLPPHPNFVRIKEFRAPPKSPSVIAPIVLGLDDVEDLMVYVDDLAKQYRNEEQTP